MPEKSISDGHCRNCPNLKAEEMSGHPAAAKIEEW
jgi:hypothetical protein